MAHQLTHAALTFAATTVTMAMSWEGDEVLHHGHVSWTVRGFGPDGNQVVTLGYKEVDGHFTTQYIFDSSPKRPQQNLAANRELFEGHLTAEFPRDHLPADAWRWRWEAALEVEGRESSERRAEVVTK